MPIHRAEFLTLAIDIGTSSTRAALFDEHGRRLPHTSAVQKYSVSYGDDGRAELSPWDLLRAVSRAKGRTVQAHQSKRTTQRLPISAIAGSALWHGLLGLDRKFRPLTSVFTWADSRAAADARRLRQDFDEQRIQQRTGCMLRSTFWPAKLRWVRRTDPKLFRRVAYWVSPSDWIFHSLFGQLRCSASMASGTGFYNARAKTWDAELLDACAIQIPALCPIADRFEPMSKTADHVTALFCPIGDGAASNLGSGADKPSVAAVNVGTSAALRTIHPMKSGGSRPVPEGLFRYVVDRTRAVTGGATSNAGNLRQWCLRELRITGDALGLEKALSRSAAANDRLTVLPFWVEERSPTWPEGQLGLIDGVNQTTSAAQITRAAATAVFYRLAQILERIENSLGPMQRIVVSGGILQSRASVKLLADALARDVEICAEPEASLRGAAVHALTQLGVKVKAPRSGKRVPHNPALAALHQKRRERQIRLERLLTGRPAPG